MKLSLPVVALLIVGIAGSAWAGELTLPKEIKALEFIERTDYEDKKLGYSIRYQDEQFLKADIYVYDMGIQNLPGGIDSPEARTELANVGKTLKKMEELGKYKEVRELESGKKSLDDSKIQFLWARHSYAQAPVGGGTFIAKRISDTFLVIHEGSFIKIRITSHEGDPKRQQEGIDALLREVSKQLQTGDPKPGDPPAARSGSK